MLKLDLNSIEILPCPCCGSYAVIEKEGNHYYKKLGKRVQFTRVSCSKTLYKSNENGRCGLKTVAMPHPKAIDSWNRRDNA